MTPSGPFSLRESVFKVVIEHSDPLVLDGFRISLEIRDGKVNPPLWAIMNEGRTVWTREGEWEYEPSPSNRDDAFLARARWTLEDAKKELETLVPARIRQLEEQAERVRKRGNW